MTRGYVVERDSAVLTDLNVYRQESRKLALADSLIRRSKLELDLALNISQAHKDQVTNLKQVNAMQKEVIEEQTKSIDKIFGKYEEAVEKKWYRRPELYGIAGLITGILIAK